MLTLAITQRTAKAVWKTVNVVVFGNKLKYCSIVNLVVAETYSS